MLLKKLSHVLQIVVAKDLFDTVKPRVLIKIKSVTNNLTLSIYNDGNGVFILSVDENLLKISIKKMELEVKKEPKQAKVETV